MAPSSAQARAAAHRSWARTPDRQARTAAGTAALMAKFEREVDPDGMLDPRDRAIRAESLRKSYFGELAIKSHRSRRLAADRSRVSVSDSPEHGVVAAPGALEEGAA